MKMLGKCYKNVFFSVVSKKVKCYENITYFILLPHFDKWTNFSFQIIIWSGKLEENNKILKSCSAVWPSCVLYMSNRQYKYKKDFTNLLVWLRETSCTSIPLIWNCELRAPRFLNFTWRSDRAMSLRQYSYAALPFGGGNFGPLYIWSSASVPDTHCHNRHP